MPANISDFKSNFPNDLSYSNRFDVKIYAPSDWGTGLDSYKLSFRCEMAQLPGRHLALVDQRTYGPTEKFPHQTEYSDVDLTFIVSSDMREKYFFDSWMEAINPSNSFDIAYKDDYACSVIINQYDVFGNFTYSVELVDAYPVNVNQLDLDWSSDGYHKLAVTFAYTYVINQTQNSFNPSGIGTSIQNLTSTTPSIENVQNILDIVQENVQNILDIVQNTNDDSTQTYTENDEYSTSVQV